MIRKTLLAENIDLSRIQIFPMPDLHNIQKWTEQMIHIFGDFNIFYSNNEWIRQYLLNYGKLVGDLLKFNFSQYNGTQIRNLICDGNTDVLINYLPREVFQYLKKIEGFERIKNTQIN